MLSRWVGATVSHARMRLQPRLHVDGQTDVSRHPRLDGTHSGPSDETPRPHPHPVMLQVHAGQDLCVVEAMKMQNVLTAPRDGVVKELLASAGATLSADQAILSFEDATKAARA